MYVHINMYFACLLLRRVVTGGQNGQIKVWNYNNGHCVCMLDKGIHVCMYMYSDVHVVFMTSILCPLYNNHNIIVCIIRHYIRVHVIYVYLHTHTHTNAYAIFCRQLQ